MSEDNKEILRINDDGEIDDNEDFEGLCMTEEEQEEVLNSLKTAEEPLDKLMEKLDKLENLWQTGMCLIQVYRDYPIHDTKGNKISGKVCEIGHKIESDWFEKNLGGGTYHVIIRGPTPKNPGAKPILGQVHNISIAGLPFVNNRTPVDSESNGGSNGTKEGAIDQVLKILEESNRRDAKRTEDLAREQRRLFEEIVKKAEMDTKANLSSMERVIAAEREAVKYSAEKSEAFLDRMFASMSDPQREQAVRQQFETLQGQIRQQSESHRDEISRIRQDHMDRERTLRDEFDRRDRDRREEFQQREVTLRDQAEKSEKQLRDIANKEEKQYRAQIEELKEQLRELRSGKERADRDVAEARFAQLRAEMAAQQKEDNPGGMMGLARSMEEFHSVAALLGLSKGDSEPSVLDQIALVLNTEPAKRVGAGIAGMLTSFASRGQQPVQQAQVLPPDSALDAWNVQQQRFRAQEAAQRPTRRAVRRRQTPQQARESAEEAARRAEEMAQSVQHPVIDSTVPQEVVDQVVQEAEAEESQYREEARQLIQIIDAGVEANKSPEEILEALTPLLGGEEALRIVAASDPDEMIGRIQEAADQRMTVTAKKLIRDCMALARKKYSR